MKMTMSMTMKMNNSRSRQIKSEQDKRAKRDRQGAQNAQTMHPKKDKSKKRSEPENKNQPAGQAKSEKLEESKKLVASKEQAKPEKRGSKAQKTRKKEKRNARKNQNSEQVVDVHARVASPSSDRFILGKLQGTGGLCEVFQATDTLRTSWGDANADLALKKILPEFKDNPKAGQLMVREFAITRQLTHPNIIRVYDMHMTAWGLAITMELLTGPSLADNIQAFPLGMGNKMLPIALQLFTAVGYLHKQGIAHGDIKPGNMTIEKGNRLVLFDFNSAVTGLRQGHAEQFDNSPALRAELKLKNYSPLYASPERIETGRASFADDIFTAASTLYHLAYGRRPYPVETALTAREQAMPLTMEDDTLPLAVSKMLTHALSFDPLARPDAKECIQAITRLSFGQKFCRLWRKKE